MRFTPHDYQAQAIDYILDHREAALWLDLGLGKTVITLTAIKELLHERFEAARVLVIAPLRVARDTWPAELAKWDHLGDLTCSVMVGTAAQRRHALQAPADIHVINRENVPWLVDQFPGKKAWPFDTVVIDEISSFKSHTAKRFKALRAVRPQVDRIIGLTGTPAANGLLDLWAQFRLLDQGTRLGKHVTHYRDRFFTPSKYVYGRAVDYRPRDGAEEQIFELIGDMTMSMKTTDHLDLPELTMARTEVELDAKSRSGYDELKRDMIAELAGAEIDAVNAAALSGKLLQLASGAVYGEDRQTVAVHEAKLDALEDLLEAANGHPVLVAYWWKHDAARILKRFPRARALRESKDFEAWNRGRVPVGLIHPASAGHGLNLQDGGHILVWFSLTWSLELYQQTNARLYRQGQGDPVSIHHIVTAGSIDEDVMVALESKDVTQSALISAVKTELRKVTS